MTEQAATDRSLIDSVEVEATPGYFEALKKRGVALDTARKVAQRALSAPNTGGDAALFAKDIERKALSKRWR